MNRLDKPAASVEIGATGEVLAIDVRALALMLGVSTRHVERMDVSGKLPAPIRLGRAKRWLLDGPTGIRAWLAAGCPNRRAWQTICEAKQQRS